MSEYNSVKKQPSFQEISSSVPLIPTPPSSKPTAELVDGTAKDKIDKKINPVQYNVKASFMITYILLLTTATVTFIEAICTKIPEVRHILNLETVISIVAGYFYSIFLGQIDTYEKEGKQINWNELTKTRYVDWAISTPLMLMALCVVLASNIKKSVGVINMVIIVILNYIMLYVGYLGESNVLNRTIAMIGGFIPFFAMFYLIFIRYVKPVKNSVNNFLYGFYILIWGLYGIVYMFKEEYKNIIMNILDCIAKCFIGLGLWVYYTKILV
jgi:bacteriorhodopsin|uniref:Bacteriorhodopsin-like protein n=1 Tax=viral metagenome TaxID=1070528 RepID=A0A6C0DM65_9ZZZZ